MKRIYVLAALLLVSAGMARAQEVALGVKGGLSIPNITPGGKKTPLSEGYSSRLAGGAGLFADIQFTKTFSLQVGLEYSGQGGKKDGMQALPALPVLEGMLGGLSGAGITLPPGVEEMIPNFVPTDYLYADFESTAKFNYLMLPVQAKFGWNLSPTSPVRFYVSAGVFGSYLLSAKRVMKGEGAFYIDEGKTSLSSYVNTNYGGLLEQYLGQETAGMILGAVNNMKTTDNTQKITDDIKSFNFGFIGAVGFSYSFCNRHKVFIEGGGNYGLVKIQKDDANGQNRIGSGSVMLGYSFML